MRLLNLSVNKALHCNENERFTLSGAVGAKKMLRAFLYVFAPLRELSFLLPYFDSQTTTIGVNAQCSDLIPDYDIGYSSFSLRL